MKATKTKLFLFLACIPVFIHFYLLQQTLINYPQWGDDFLFLELLDYSKTHSVTETFSALFIPHNQIHIIAWAKGIAYLNHLISGTFNFKLLNLLVNIQWIAILFIFYRYLIRNKYPLVHLLGIACCLFAPLANQDSYSLLGSLTHTSSLLFLVSIAYLIENQTKKGLLVILLALYPLILTEGWAMFVIGSFLVIYNKHAYARTITGLCTLGLIYFAFHLNQQPPSNENILALVSHMPVAFFTFLGNFAWPISDSYRNIINASAGIIILCISSLLFSKQRGITMPFIIWLQLLATAFMVCIGRGGGNLETLVLSERFHSYSTMALVSTYLILIPYAGGKWSNVFIGFSVIYFIGSWVIFMPVGNKLTNRLRADLTNAVKQNACTSYQVPSTNFRLIKDKDLYKYSSADIIEVQTSAVSSYQSLETPISNQELQLAIDAKAQESDNRWLAIQSKANTDAIFIAPFFSDKAKKSKIVHINSLQLTDLKGKNLWLYTEHRKGETQTKYLGTIK